MQCNAKFKVCLFRKYGTLYIMIGSFTYTQWRISVLKYGGGGSVSQVKPSNCFRLHRHTGPRQWFPNTQQSRFLTACRRLEKNCFTFRFDSLSSFIVWNLQSYPTVLNERMWLLVVKTNSDLLHIFRGRHDPPNPPQDLRPCLYLVHINQCSANTPIPPHQHYFRRNNS